MSEYARRKYYIEKITKDLTECFEKETGKTIMYDGTFDMSEIINFYGGLIEFSDIYEDEYKLKAYIVYVKDNPDYNFKIVVDDNIKNSLINNNIYSEWNMFILKYFWFVIDCIYVQELNMEDNDIIYPNVDVEKMKYILERIKINKHSTTNNQKECIKVYKKN